MCKLIVSTLVAMLIVPVVQAQQTITDQTAAEIMQTMKEREAARSRGIDGYFIRETTGIPNTPDTFLYFEAVKGGAGGAIGFRQVNPGEAVMEAVNQMGPDVAADGLPSRVAAGTVMARGAVAVTEMMGFYTSLYHEELGESIMEMGGGAYWAFFKSPEEQKQVPRDAAAGAARFAAQANFINAISADGHEAYYLFKDELNQTQSAEGVDYTINSVGLLIDKNRYVALGMRFDGVAKRKGKSEPFFIQRIDRKHQYLKSMNGGNTSMLIPYETTMTLGLPSISENDQMDVAKAKKDLAKARREIEQNMAQLDALPANQRAQFKKMMGNALRQAERQVRRLENKKTMQITKTVVDARAGTVEQYAEWMKEQMKTADAFTGAKSGTTSAIEQATEEASQ